MRFDYAGYRGLLDNLKAQKYEFCDYHNYEDCDRCVILRHDIDTSLPKALQMAELEAKEKVSSTYFVLLSSDFYNAFSASSKAAIKKIAGFGHKIGLHFDIKAYEHTDNLDEAAGFIRNELELLARICGKEAEAFSFHRPDERILAANLEVNGNGGGAVNAYSKKFFREIKYLSDSRRNWREPVMEIINSGAYKRLQIVTHAFWYHDAEESINKTVSDFIHAANQERYGQMMENITDLPSIMRKEEV